MFFKTTIKSRSRVLSSRVLMVFGVLFILGLFIIFIVAPRWQREVRPVRAASSANVRGWGWSENVGWLSMNCYNDFDDDDKFECCCPGGAGGVNCLAGGESCPYSLTCSSGSSNPGTTCTSDGDCPNGYCGGDYGVDADSSSHKVSGYAWADHVGWVCFGESCTCAECTSCANYADCTTCSGCPNEVKPPAGQAKPWACVGKESWKCEGTDTPCYKDDQCGSNKCVFTCDGDKGEGFRDTADLKGHWKMNELGTGTGGCAVKQADCTPDETGNHPAFLKPNYPTNNAPKQAIGKYGYALQFDGEDDYLEVADATGISFTNAFTVEAWVKRGSIGIGTTGAQTILSKWDESITNGRSYRLWFDNENKLNFSVSNNGTSVINTYQLNGICLGAGRKLCYGGTNNGNDCSDKDNTYCSGGGGICIEPLCSSDDNCQEDEICKNAPVIDTKKWHHIAAKYVNAAGNTPFISMFIDGQLIDSKNTGTVPASVHDSDWPLYIGAKKGSAGAMDTSFDGVIDNVSVWSTPKTGNAIWDDAKIEMSGWAKVVSMAEGGWLNLRNYTLGDRVWGLYLRDYKTFYTLGGYMAERHNNEEMDANGLKAHWKFNQPEWGETSGEIIDSSGQANHGTAVNGASTSDKGKFSNTGEFDGVNDYVSVPDTDSLDFSSALTVELWFRADALGSEIICKSNSDVDENFRVFLGASNVIYFDYGNANQYAQTSALTIATGVWYHFAGVVQAGQPGKIYLNGQEAGSYTNQANAPIPLLTNNNSCQIGGCVFTSRYFDGLIDNVAVYNRAKSASEIANDYAKRLPYSVGWDDYDHGYADPPAPSEFNTLSLSNSGGCETLLVYWDPADWADSYTYYRCDDVIEGTCGSVTSTQCDGVDYDEYNYLGTCEETECALTDTGLIANTGYCYKVKAHNETDSTWITNTPITHPAPQWISTTLCAPVPQEIDTSVCGQMTPLWNAVAGADGYNTYRSLASNGCSTINSSTCELVGHLGEGLDADADDDGTNDLIAHWKMNEAGWDGSNNEVKDSSGEKNHGRAVCDGACTEPTTVASGWFDRGGVFDGVDDYLDMTKPPGQFDLTDSFTVEAWVNPALDSTNDIIIGNAYEGSKGWHLRITSGNKARLMLSEDADNYEYAESSVLNSGWHHLVGVWNGSEPALYLDGEEDSTVVISGTLTDISNNDKTYIGNIAGQTLYFKGKIDNVAIYNVVKSTEKVGLAEQIRVDYEAGNCGETACGLSDVCHTASVNDGHCNIKVGDSNYNTNTCCYTDQRIVPYIDYYYRVTAVSQAGESPASSPVKSGQTKCFPARELEEE